MLDAPSLLIADGHHRYETTLAYHAEEGTEESAWLLVVIVPTEQDGLTIFPTHRMAERLEPVDGERPFDGELPDDRSAAVIYRSGGTTVVTGEPGEPDTALVDRLGLEGVTYTPHEEEAKAAVDSGAAAGRSPRTPAERRARSRARRARRDDAAEEHVLLPQAALRPPVPSAVTDWLELCRAAAVEVEVVLAELPTRDERELVVGAGEGGDDTTAIDDAAERAVVALLDSAGVDFALVSEELGHRAATADGAVTVVLDPIDGSINAKRGIPFFSLSLAVAEGPTMADVVFGFVHDFGSGEEWSAVRGDGARLDGEPLDAPLPKESIELLGLEATKTALVAEHAPASDADRRAAAGDGIARALALPPRSRAGGRRRVAAAGEVGGHRGGAAARTGAGPHRRALRRAAARGRAARPRAALASSGCSDP